MLDIRTEISVVGKSREKSRGESSRLVTLARLRSLRSNVEEKIESFGQGLIRTETFISFPVILHLSSMENRSDLGMLFILVNSHVPMLLL